MTGIDLTLLAELLALGAVAGFLAGLLGVGGGMMMVPFLTWLFTARSIEPGLAVKMAIATSMATIVFTSLSSVRAHHRRGAVRWDVVKRMAPGIVAGGAVAGAGVFAWIDGRLLSLCFAAVVGVSAAQMWRNRPTVASRRMPGTAGQAGFGAVVGFASGLAGAGGAFLSVPFMTRCNVAIHQAVATSAALGVPIALANTAGYLVAGAGVRPVMPGAFGYLYLPALAIISIASVLMAPLGARVSHSMDVLRLKRWFAGLLFMLAASMLYRAWGG